MVVTATTGIVYTVPAGVTALVKEWLWTDQGTTATNIRVFLNGTALGNRMILVGSASAGTVTFSPSFVVLQPGDVIRMQLAAAGNINSFGFGAELDGVAP